MNKYIFFSTHDTGNEQWEEMETIFADNDDIAMEKADYYYRKVYSASRSLRVTRESKFGEFIGSLP